MVTRNAGALLIMGLGLAVTTVGCVDDRTYAHVGGHEDAEADDGGDTTDGAGTADAGLSTLDEAVVDAGEPDSTDVPMPDAATSDAARVPECEPGEAMVCGSGVGACEVGARTCSEDGTWSACVAVISDLPCENDADCAGAGVCLTTVLTPRDSLVDDCTSADREACRRSTCAAFEGEQACDGDAECGGTDVCVSGWCLRPVTVPMSEVCNGIDDDCDSLVDNEIARLEICGLCPWGMVNVFSRDGETSICVDRYEASRAIVDGVETELYAASVAGADPWTGLGSADANWACRGQAYRDAVGTARPAIATRRLCDTSEWQRTCAGAERDGESRLWPWAEPGDTGGFVEGAAVDWTVADGPAPTGSAPLSCLAPNADEPDAIACDLVGNVGEWVFGPGAVPMIAGGSYADLPADGSSDIATRLSCGDGMSYPTPVEPLDEDALRAVGFRCCTTPVLER